MIFSPQQLQVSHLQLCTQLSRYRCISWSLNVVLAVTAIALLLVVSLDVVQAAFCVHLVLFCITCAVLLWTKDSRNAFGMSLGFSVAHFLLLLCIIWDCEPLFFVLKLALISCLWFDTRVMRITSFMPLNINRSHECESQLFNYWLDHRWCLWHRCILRVS